MMDNDGDEGDLDRAQQESEPHKRCSEGGGGGADEGWAEERKCVGTTAGQTAHRTPVVHKVDRGKRLALNDVFGLDA
jgi:hypothetical protein